MTDNKAWSSRQTSFVSSAGSLQVKTEPRFADCPHGHFSLLTLFGFSLSAARRLRPAANLCSQNAAPGLPSGGTRGCAMKTTALRSQPDLGRACRILQAPRTRPGNVIIDNVITIQEGDLESLHMAVNKQHVRLASVTLRVVF